jgi:HD-GYP domain-containing protein (c-di-GMP phosphodiesterase class II)
VSKNNILKFSKSYFSINFDLIRIGYPLGYELYVNSSSLASRERFIKVFHATDAMEEEDLVKLKQKYLQLYVAEAQRGAFLKSLSSLNNQSDTQKTEIIKDSALKYLHGIFDSGKEFTTELLSETIDGCREAVTSMVDVLDHHNVSSLHKLIGNLSFHDFYTYDHSINVSMYCITILKEVKPDATREELITIGLGGLLHDLGKIKIPTDILNNPGKLTEEEYQEIKKHPSFGVDLLLSGHCECDESVDLSVIGRIIHEHHENWDGSGYPNKLSAEEIHFSARICAIADFFDAITTKRSYNEVLNIDNAIGVMEKTAGKKIDPEIFTIFTSKVKKMALSKNIDLQMADSFDPTLAYEKLPLEKVKVEKPKQDFGKIKVSEDFFKKKSDKKAS